MQDKNSNNKEVLLKTIGDIIKSHRIAENKSIYKISAEGSLPKSTWRSVEISLSKDINITTLWKIAEGLDIPLWKLLKEVQEKLGKDFSLDENDF